jgi:hypothetical protein
MLFILEVAILEYSFLNYIQEILGMKMQVMKS